MAATRLLPIQQKFLKHLFGTALGNLQKAAELSDVEDYSLIMTQELMDAIKDRADQELRLSVPKAVFTLQNILNNPESTMFMDKLTKVCTEVLDRAGLGKIERGGGGKSLQIGLVILPDKIPIKDAEFTEVMAIENGGIQTKTSE